MRQSPYVRYDNQFHQPRRRKPDYALRFMVGLTVVLLVAVAALVISTLLKKPPKESGVHSSLTGSSDVLSETTISGGISIATPTPPPVAEKMPYHNPVLFPATAQVKTVIGQPSAELIPSAKINSQVIFSADTELAQYARDPAIRFTDPLHYQTIPGILTFRGNNFRNCASWGTVTVEEGALEQVWEYNRLGSMSGWGGTAWTGQPLAVQWDFELQQKMNMYPDKRLKQGLTEVIQAALDGKIHFFDIDDGMPTRDPIVIGASVKGTPSLDPRGYPLIYVGQGLDNQAEKKMGFRIYSLIDGTLLHFQSCKDSRAPRNWYGSDSSPIINAETDTLIFPSENGLIYSLKLNTFYEKESGRITVSPETIVYRYLANNLSGVSYGIESSLAVYDHYGYFSDNSGNLCCLDLNTFQMVWVKNLRDDSDVTSVLEEDNGRVYLYIGTEVDWQKNELDYMGASYTYKIDAMTGEEVWQTSQSCWTHNESDPNGDINGGMLGTPVIGKKNISDLVIFSYCQTKGRGSGNRLVAYSKLTGEQVWAYEMNMYSWSSPVDCYDAEGNAYIVMCDSLGQVHLVNGQNGERITYLQTIINKGTGNEITTGSNMESSPIVFGNMIVIGSRSSSVFGILIK